MMISQDDEGMPPHIARDPVKRELWRKMHDVMEQAAADIIFGKGSNPEAEEDSIGLAGIVKG